MATGDPVLATTVPAPPAANGATLGYRQGGSTPGEVIETFTFVDGSITYLDLLCSVNPKYTGGAFKVRLPWLTTVTTGNCRWEAAFRRFNASANTAASFTYTYKSLTTAAHATANSLSYPTIAFTQTEAAGLLANEVVVLRVRRRGDDGTNDTLTASAYLVATAILAVED